MALDTILVIIDPTSDTQTAFDRALTSAQDTGAALHLYTCTRKEDTHELSNRLNKLTDQASGEGVAVSNEVEKGSDWAAGAVAAAARLSASMIFKNSTDHTAIDREKRRTSDWTLLRTSPCPVLMVKNFHDWGQRKVLAAINPASTEAAHIKLDHQIVSFTRQLATAYGSDAHFVTAFHDLNHPPQREKIALHCCVEPANIHIQQGKASDVIRDVAAALDVDLVVVGTVGRDGMKGRVIGNTCERLLDQTHSDVLVLN